MRVSLGKPMFYLEESNVEYAKKEYEWWLHILLAAKPPGVSPGAVFKLTYLNVEDNFDCSVPYGIYNYYSHLRYK